MGWGNAGNSLDLNHDRLVHLSPLVCSGFSEISNSLYIEFWVFFSSSIPVDLWKTKSQGFELSDHLARRFLMPLELFSDLTALCGEKLSEWSISGKGLGVIANIKLQIPILASASHLAAQTKVLYIKEMENKSLLSLLRERSWLQLTNTVQCILPTAKPVVHCARPKSFNRVNFIA